VGRLEGWLAAADRQRRGFEEGGVVRLHGSAIDHEWQWSAVRLVPTAGEIEIFSSGVGWLGRWRPSPVV
jgi:hypothetical protein